MDKLMILITYLFAESRFSRNLKNLSIWNETNIFRHDLATVYKPYMHHVNHYPQAEVHRNLNSQTLWIKQIYIHYSSLKLAILDIMNKF